MEVVEISRSLDIITHYKAFNKITTTDYEIIKSDLERLEILDKLVTDDCIAGNQVGLDIVNNLIERANKYKEKAKQLEKENQKYLEELKRWGYPETPIHISKYKQLEKENEELKDKLNSEALDNWQLHCKYGKYKKAIEILKEHFSFTFTDKYYLLVIKKYDFEKSARDIFVKQPEQYELLKEMLENE